MRTRYPGVKPLGSNRYRIRVKATDRRTGRGKEVDKIVVCPGGVAEAVTLREELRREVEAGGAGASARVRLADFAASWLRGRLPTLKASTRARYAEILDGAILPALGDVYLDALRPSDVQAWVARLTEEYSAQTVVNFLRVLRTLCRDAVAEYDLPRDPCARVKAPRPVGYTEEDPNLLQPAQLRKMLEAVRDHEPKWYPLLATLALTGIRWGEATALQWGDVDEGAGVIRVRRAQWRGHLGTTKTGKPRSVPLVPELAAVLREQRARVAHECPWVFPSDTGRPHHHGALRKPLQRACSRADAARRGGVIGGVIEGPRCTVHGLRRTFNNLARQVAAGEVVRSITGHCTPSMTEHYSSVGTSEKLAAATRVWVLVAGKSGDGGGDSLTTDDGGAKNPNEIN